MSDMTVRRVETAFGSHIEPPLEQSWSKTQKLEWHAAVTALDTGLKVRVAEGDFSERRFGKWRPVPGYYSIQVGSGSCGPLTYRDAWTYLNGVSAGARDGGSR